MEECFINGCAEVSRIEADRVLRTYRKMNSILRSSRSYGRHFGDGDMDEAVIHSQMYSLRALVLSVEDARERMFLYHYYIKGATLETCAKLLGVSIRTISRIKNSALDNICLKINAEKQCIKS